MFDTVVRVSTAFDATARAIDRAPFWLKTSKYIEAIDTLEALLDFVHDPDLEERETFHLYDPSTPRDYMSVDCGLINVSEAVCFLAPLYADVKSDQ